MSKAHSSGDSSNQGQVRTDPYTPKGTPQPASTATPTQVPKAWTSELDRVALDDRTGVLCFLEHVAQGHADGASTAQAVFNDLIAHEAFDVFVQAFTAYNAVLKSQVEADGKPFTSTLTLQLPRGWAPIAPVAMHEAFKKIHVQRLEVFQPKPDDGPTLSRLSVSKAVCDGVATLLSNGETTQLAVWGELADASVVGQALENGDGIDSLELGKDRLWEPLSGLEKEGYEALLTGEKTRARLQHLAINNADMLSHLVPSMDPEARWPALRSLTVKMGRAVSAPHLESFLRVAAISRQLTTVSLSFAEEGAESHMESLLNGLKNHPSLTRLDLSAGFRDDSPVCLDFLPMAVEFACSCPSLTHFTWDSGASIPSAGRLMEYLRRLPPSGDPKERLKAMEAALKNPDIALKSFSMTGFPCTQDALYILFEALAYNRSIEHLDLSACCVDIEATKALTASLKTNTTLRTPVLPDRPGSYYWTVAKAQGAICGLTRGPRSSHATHEGLHDDFQLNPHVGVGEEALAFDSDLKAHADTLQIQLYEHQRKLIGEDAFSTLAMNVAHYMAVRMAIPGDRPDAALFKDVAERITRELEDEGALRKIVRFSEVEKAADRRAVRTPGPLKPPQGVKALVTLNTELAVARGLPSAPLVVNTVDVNHANAQLTRAVRTHDPRMVAKLLSDGAIDFGGHALRSAPPGPLRHAFLSVNRLHRNGANVQLMAAVKANDRQAVRRLLVKRAIDFDDHAARSAHPDSAVRALLVVNRMDESGANARLMAAVKANDHGLVLHLRAQGAIDFGSRARTAAGDASPAVRAAFVKVAVMTKPTTTTTTTNGTTTTTTTGTTTAGAVPVRVLQTRTPRGGQKEPGT